MTPRDAPLDGTVGLHGAAVPASPALTSTRAEGARAIPRTLAGAIGSLRHALDPAAWVSIAGLAAAAVVAVALGLFITSQVRRDILIAEQRGLASAVAAIEGQLPDLSSGALAPAELEAVDALVSRAVLGDEHVRVKLWALDGTIRYSDVPDLVGTAFPERAGWLATVAAGDAAVDITRLLEPEHLHERAHGQLIESYIPVRDGDGLATGVFEIYTRLHELDAAVGRIAGATWVSIGLGLGVLGVFLVLLLASTVRRVERGRVIAVARADELRIMLGATDALAASLEPPRMLAGLGALLRDALRLDDVAIATARPPEAAGQSSFPLRDGSWLVMTRREEAFGSHEVRLLRSVAQSVDVALSNAELYAGARESAVERRRLLGLVATAHEDERRRIVGDLHDLLAGELIRLLYGIRGIMARGPTVPSAVGEELVALESTAVLAERRLREFMGRIRPVGADEIGLVPALEHAVGRARSEAGLNARLRIMGPADSLSPAVQHLLLRSSEEALLNVVKHAGARRVLVRLRVADDDAVLSVDDDGAGWAPGIPAGIGRGIGLAYARERAAALGGSLDTERSRLGGARLVLRLPVGAGP
jgi:signal transduction histidine kinase